MKKIQMTTQNNAVNYSLHEQSFLSYIEPFLQKKLEPCLVLKKEHTFRVVESTELIIKNLFLSDEDRYCAKLIALYHDIGRFLQYEKYQTFLDNKSEDHAYIAVRILKKHAQFLKEPVHIQKKILSAVMLHNKIKLPDKLPDCYKELCQIIRDADKIDIFRVMMEHFDHDLPDKEQVTLSVKDEPLLYSKHILDRAMQKSDIKYIDLVYVNDFKILICAWIFSLFYSQSKAIIKEKGYIQTILATLPKTKELEDFSALIAEELNSL